ncbi:MAG: TonB-dependent receptor [Bryobacterales bacterium]|nr:TonB-dependent receptor [Bryobacterales bacterium]
MQLPRLWLALLVPCALGAQVTGTLAGSVADASESVVPGVRVTAFNEGTGEKRETETNGAGQFALGFLQPGVYTIEFTAPGFNPARTRAVLNVSERAAVNIVLQPAVVAETVIVTAEAPGLLQTETATLGRVVDQRTMQQLPLATRNFTQLLALSPGTAAPLNDASALGRGTQNLSAGGMRRVSNSIRIDGLDVINIHTNSSVENTQSSNGVMIPSPEAIQEFKVQTSLYDAQHGRSGGANVNLVTRSGGNRWHGALFEFFRNEKLNANDFFFNRNGQPRAMLKQNQFGGTLGGPVAKDRTFFFVSYQGTRQRNGLTGSRTITLPALGENRSRADLGATFAGLTGVRGGVSVAPDGSNLNPVALAVLNYRTADGSYLIPSPQTGSATGNFSVSLPATYTEDQGSFSFDHSLTARNRLTVRGFVTEQPQVRPFQLANVPGFGVTQDFHGKFLSLTDVHAFTSSLVNEFRAGATRTGGKVIPQTIVRTDEIGMARFNAETFPDIPDINVGGAFRIGYSVDADQAGMQNIVQLADTVSWSRTRHQVRAGFELRQYQSNYFNNNRARGAIAFQSFADFLLGRPAGSVAQGGTGTNFSNLNTSSVASGVVQRDDRLTDTALFIQDDWKITPRLTLNFGLRWEFLGFTVDKRGRNGNFYPHLYAPPPPGGTTSAGFVQSRNAERKTPGLPEVHPTMLDGDRWNNFAPRAGFAYRVSDRLALRGGYGMFHDRLSNQVGLRAALAPPNYLRINLSGADTAPYSLQNPFPVLPQRDEFPIVPLLGAPPYTVTNPAVAMNAIDPGLRTPYVQQYALNLQYQLHSFLIEAGYAGSKGVSLPSERLINQALLASPEAPINGVTTNTAANAVQRTPFLGFSPQGLVWVETATDSRYNSLQFSVTKRLSRGLQFLAGYTFSKSLDNNSGNPTQLLDGISGDQLNPAQAKGLSEFDIPHRVVTSFVFDLPDWTRGRWSRVFGGWQTAGVVTAQSGVPFTITDSGAAALYGVSTSRGSWAPGATIASARRGGRVQDRLQAFFDTAAFVRPGQVFGNTGRNILRGPAVANVDLSAIKRTAVTEKAALEFRAEFFNLFNKANFSSPASAVNTAATFGAIQSTQGNPRLIQLALKLLF